MNGLETALPRSVTLYEHAATPEIVRAIVALTKAPGFDGYCPNSHWETIGFHPNRAELHPPDPP